MNQKHSGHERAHEQSVQTILGDEPRPRRKRPPWGHDLRWSILQGGDQEPSNDGAVQSRCGARPDAIANGLRSGSATRPNRDSCEGTAANLFRCNPADLKMVLGASLSFSVPTLSLGS